METVWLEAPSKLRPEGREPAGGDVAGKHPDRGPGLLRWARCSEPRARRSEPRAREQAWRLGAVSVWCGVKSARGTLAGTRGTVAAGQTVRFRAA